MLNDLIKSAEILGKMQKDWPAVQRFMNNYAELSGLKSVSDEPKEEKSDPYGDYFDEKESITELVYEVFKEANKPMKAKEIKWRYKKRNYPDGLNVEEDLSISKNIQSALSYLKKKDKISLNKDDWTYTIVRSTKYEIMNGDQ